MKKTNLLWFCLICTLTIISMVGCASTAVTGDIGSDKVLNASKNLGKRNSPCAIITVRFDSGVFQADEEINSEITIMSP